MNEYKGTINYNPPVLVSPFALSGDKNDITSTPISSNSATLSGGFPSITAGSKLNGAVPPRRGDFNAMGYISTAWDYYLQNGGVVSYDKNISDAINGYPKNARLYFDATDLYHGIKFTWLLRSLKDNNTVDPKSEVRWIYEGTSTNWSIENDFAYKDLSNTPLSSYNQSQQNVVKFPDYANSILLLYKKNWKAGEKVVIPEDGWVRIYSDYNGTSADLDLVLPNGASIQIKFKYPGADDFCDLFTPMKAGTSISPAKDLTGNDPYSVVEFYPMLS